MALDAQKETISKVEETLLRVFQHHCSEGTAITRGQLRALTNHNDRVNRLAIASLQAKGHPIISLKKGYFLGTEKDVEHYVRREKCRAISILAKLKHLQPKLSHLIQQMKLF